MIELRWVLRDIPLHQMMSDKVDANQEKVLQYRNFEDVCVVELNGAVREERIHTEWKDVETVTP